MPKVNIRMRTQSKKEPKVPEEWISWKLKKTFLISLIIVTVILIVAIVTLLVCSHILHGFVTVTNRPYIGLTWTSVPSFMFNIYGVCMTMVVTAFSFRQPFIELKDGAVARKSIALDYGSYFPGRNVYEAGQNGHRHLAVSFLVSSLLTMIIGPLAAHLMSEEAYTQREGVDLSQNQALFATYGLNDSLGWDLAPVIGLTSATTVYGGTYSQWIDKDRAYLNFSTPTLQKGNISQAQVEANTTAYFAELNCAVLNTDNADNHWRIEPDETNGNTGIFFTNTTDRGCSWITSFKITQGFTTYMQTASNVSCGSFDGSDSTGRLIIVGAHIENLQPSQLTILSCVPTYWASNGSLKVDLNSEQLYSIRGFNQDETTVRELRPQWWNSYEHQIHQIQFADTTVNFGADSTTAVGNLILAYARRNLADPLSGESIVIASQAVWSTMYASLVNTFMLRPAVSSTFHAMLSTTTNKIFVSDVIAGILLGLLVVATGLLFLILFYTKNHTSVLFEEPVGILSYAGILVDSDVNKMAVDARKEKGFKGKTREDVMKGCSRADHDFTIFRMANLGDPSKARIARDRKDAGGEELLSLTSAADGRED